MIPTAEKSANTSGKLSMCLHGTIRFQCLWNKLFPYYHCKVCLDIYMRLLPADDKVHHCLPSSIMQDDSLTYML